MLEPEVWAKFFILLVGIGLGFCAACLASAKIVAENYDLKKKLEKVKAERNLLLTLNRQLATSNPNVEYIEIHDRYKSIFPEGDFFNEF